MRQNTKSNRSQIIHREDSIHTSKYGRVQDYGRDDGIYGTSVLFMGRYKFVMVINGGKHNTA